MRILIEIAFLIVAIIVARAVLTRVVQGLFQAAASSRSYSNQPQNEVPRGGEPPVSGRELHRDPVCGTYVAENSGLSRQTGNRTYYYCSKECRDKHVVVA